MFALCVRGRALLPARGVALGVALFAAIGVPWFALLVHRDPAILDWFLNVQLASRVTGTDRGHLKDATYLLRIAVLGLLPWTPILGARALPRCGRADACATPIPSTCSLIAWALVPVLLFSLFPTKLGSYIAPAFPGAALVVARAGSRGLLDDRRARRMLAACGALVFAAALVAGGALLARRERLRLRPRDVARAARAIAPRSPSARCCSRSACSAAFALPRIARRDAARAYVATAVASRHRARVRVPRRRGRDARRCARRDASSRACPARGSSSSA